MAQEAKALLRAEEPREGKAFERGSELAAGWSTAPPTITELADPAQMQECNIAAVGHPNPAGATQYAQTSGSSLRQPAASG